MLSLKYIIVLLFLGCHLLSFTVFLAENEFVSLLRLLSALPAILFLPKRFIRSDLFILVIYTVSVRHVLSLYYVIIYLAIVLIIRSCENEFKRVSQALLIGATGINVILLIIPQSGIETWELRGGNGILQYSGIFTSPTSLGLILVLSLFLITDNIKFLGRGVFILLGLLTRSRQFLIGLLLYGIQWKFLRLLLLPLILMSGKLIWNAISISNVEGRILGSRTEVYELFYVFIQENFSLLGLGVGSASSVVEGYLGHDYSFHSSYLNLVIEMGLFSLFIIVFFVKKLIQKRLFVFILLGFTTSIFDYSTALLFPWIYFLINESTTSYRPI